MSENGWVKYIDEKSGAPYYYNAATNESKWAVQEELSTTVRFTENPVIANQEINGHDFGGDIEMNCAIPDNDGEISMTTTSTIENEELSSLYEYSNQSESLTEEFKSLILDRHVGPDVYVDDGTSTTYMRCIRINAVLVESPLCVLEGIVRTFVLVFMLMGHIIYKFFIHCRKKSSGIGSLCLVFYQPVYLREIALTMAATFSFAIPLLILSLYRKYDGEQHIYELSPIPTILGWVDPRRFCIITFGGGSQANYPPGGITKRNLDSWKGKIVLAPREVIDSVAAFVNGTKSAFAADTAAKRRSSRMGGQKAVGGKKKEGGGGGAEGSNRSNKNIKNVNNINSSSSNGNSSKKGAEDESFNSARKGINSKSKPDSSSSSSSIKAKSKRDGRNTTTSAGTAEAAVNSNSKTKSDDVLSPIF